MSGPDAVSTKRARAGSVFDLRRWLEKARAIDQLRDVRGANLKFEVGAITELNAKRNGPALLFDNFEGYPEGFRVLTGSMLNAKTFALATGIEEDVDNLTLVNRVAEVLRKVTDTAKDYPVEYVESGPVMENRFSGDDIDLTKFPTPLWHEMDGGPYIGTGVIQVHRDPDTNWVNVGAYRVQLQGRNLVSNVIGPGHHGGLIRQKYFQKGNPCPVVMCFGVHPLLHLIGACDVPYEENEFNWIGVFGRQRVPVIRGPVTGLPIPADAEIAIEALVYPGEEKMEGPFGEFTGYYAAGKTPQPLAQVKALYYRNQPIMLGSPPARQPDDVAYYFSVLRAANIKETLRKAGIPGVKAVWVSPAGGGRMWIVTSIKQQYAGHAMQAAGVAALCQAGALMCRYSIVVDEDIDPSNNDDLIWALCTRTDPATDIDVVRNAWNTHLDPMLSAGEKDAKRLWNNRALINACKPWDRLKANDFPPVAEASPELLRATREKWAWLFR